MRSSLGFYLTRFAIIVVAVPLCFLATLMAASTWHVVEPEPAAAVVGALCFAAVVTAPSSRNALVRAALMVGVSVLLAGTARFFS